MLAIVTAILSQEHGADVLPPGIHVKGHGECNPLDMSAYCQFRGFAAVGIALGLFIGLPVLILSTNIGVRKASGVLLGALFAYMTIHGFLWMIYPRGPLVTHKVAGLPLSISSRMPAIITMVGGGGLLAVVCFVLDRLDRPQVDEPTLKE